MKAQPEAYVSDVRKFLSRFHSVSEFTTELVKLKYLAMLKTLKGARGTAIKSRTICNKLRTVKIFLDHLIADQSIANPVVKLDSASKACIQSISIQIPNWIRSHRKRIREEDHDFRDFEHSLQVEREDCVRYASSAHYRSVQASLERLTTTKSTACKAPSFDEFIDYRNFIITNLCMLNGCRSGSIINLSIKDFDRDIKKEHTAYIENGSDKQRVKRCVFNVKKGKTRHAYGSTKMVIHGLTLTCLKAYAKLRKLMKTASTRLFVSFGGSNMTQSNVCGAMSSSFYAAGIKKRVSATKLRKMLVRAIYDNTKDQRLRDSAAVLMMHSASTAVRSYRYVERRHHAVIASEFIHKLLKPRTQTTATPAVAAAGTAGVIESDVDGGNERVDQPQDDDQPEDEPQISPCENEGDQRAQLPAVKVRRGMKTRWTNHSERIVATAFHHEINSLRAISATYVKAKLNTLPVSTQDLCAELSVTEEELTKKVREKIRVFQKPRTQTTATPAVAAAGTAGVIESDVDGGNERVDQPQDDDQPEDEPQISPCENEGDQRAQLPAVKVRRGMKTRWTNHSERIVATAFHHEINSLRAISATYVKAKLNTLPVSTQDLCAELSVTEEELTKKVREKIRVFQKKLQRRSEIP